MSRNVYLCLLISPLNVFPGYAGPLNLNTQLVGHPNGAVVPVDEPAVQAARAEHLAAKGAIAYAAPALAHAGYAGYAMLAKKHGLGTTRKYHVASSMRERLKHKIMLLFSMMRSCNHRADIVTSMFVEQKTKSC